MLSIRYAAIAAIIFLFSSSVSFAADLLEAPQPADPWTGLYIGGHVGWGWGSQDFEGACVCGPTDIDVDYDGVIGGAQIGFNYQFAPQWLFGVEADISWADIDGDGEADLPVPDGTTGIAEMSTSIDLFGTIRARLGYIFDNLLVYGTGGLAWGDVETRFHVPYVGEFPDDLNGSTSETAWGWTVGGGTEYALDDHWRVKVEYLYVALNSGGDDLEATGSFGFFSETEDLDFHVVRAGVNYQF